MHYESIKDSPWFKKAWACTTSL